ncbi:hypothetical protein HUG15_18390 [Salicibibacter cibarius]|uniref:DUF2651 domain-containing protein n=1 Tax=Salicibibacter cibarius TaxID=2743000 RepID=A0A7T6Z5H3_9BACI|nr:hypothetical protein [Salicibibacter cibarius]QQK77353.1 hypothetical protein HUG15_18390 [Salicibibacter cibarius]
MDQFTLLTFFNPIITLILGFIISNIFGRKKVQWIIGIAVTVLFFFLIVMINDLNLSDGQTWVYFSLYVITMLIGMVVAITTRKYRYNSNA